MNRDGIWSSEPAIFKFEVLPAWWEIRWVQFLGVAAALALLLAIIRFRISRVRAAAKRLRIEVNRKTEVIQKQLQTMELQKDKLEFLAVTDDLTMIHNRRYFFSVLAAEWKRSTRYKRPLSLILFDIDHFKDVNDSYGHVVGDEVLIQIAQKIGSIVRDCDTLARFGGEEFIVLLPETDELMASGVGERIRIAISEMEIQAESYGNVTVTISGGISTKVGERGAMNPDGLIRQSDLAMYQAKEEGRNRIVTYSGP